MKGAIPAFARAVFWGALAGGGPFLLLTVPAVLEAPDWSQPNVIWVIWIAVMPIALAIPVVILASALLGLPLILWLARRKDERRVIYTIVGLGLGFLLPMGFTQALTGDLEFAPIIAIPGAIAGTVTGTSWGRWREQVAAKPAQL